MINRWWFPWVALKKIFGGHTLEITLSCFISLLSVGFSCVRVCVCSLILCWLFLLLHLTCFTFSLATSCCFIWMFIFLCWLWQRSAAITWIHLQFTSGIVKNEPTDSKKKKMKTWKSCIYQEWKTEKEKQQSSKWSLKWKNIEQNVVGTLRVWL